MANIKHSDMHSYNRTAVLNMIRQDCGISRADIAKRTDLSVPSISALVNSLIQDGLIAEVGVGESQGGRKPIMLRFEADARLIIAIDIRPEHATGMVCNLDALPVKTLKTAYPESLPIEEKLTLASDIVQALIDSVADQHKIIGIGIAVVGLIDCKNRIIRYSAPLNCRNVHLDRFFGKFQAYPIHVNNISRCESLAEKWFGRGKNISDFIFIYAGIGIGAGMISGGRINNRSQYSAMEIGHNTVHAHGEQCRCGRKGCLEAYSALWSIKKQYAGATGNDNLSDDDVLDAIRKREPLMRPILERALYYLGLEIANLTNIFNPETVIIDGWLHSLEASDIEYLTDIVKHRALEGLTDRFSIMLSSFKNKGAIVGAATMPLESFLQPLDKELFDA
ncbi:MAG: ROK family transcriptional regulator [Bacillota bacterium]